jgi:hypothetical protein
LFFNHGLNGMDVPEWVGISPAGETQTRAETLASLEPLLAIPPEKRPALTLDFLYFKETGWNVLVLDTWVRTAAGLRRIRHEKFFPDRVLITVY